MQIIKDIKDALLHLAFPHICEGCGSNLVDTNHFLCLECLSILPHTKFHLHPDNPIEKIFWGRLPLHAATAAYYFSKESLMQHLIHQLKYKGNQSLGLYLGKLMGHSLLESGRFNNIDVIIPLPLHASREFKRGYNQAYLLTKSISEVLQKPVLLNAVTRTEATDSQTRKGRVERWENMEGKFRVINTNSIKGKHVLLIDDVITTGATLEACGRKIVDAGAELSIATLCFSTH